MERAGKNARFDIFNKKRPLGRGGKKQAAPVLLIQAMALVRQEREPLVLLRCFLGICIQKPLLSHQLGVESSCLHFQFPGPLVILLRRHLVARLGVGAGAFQISQPIVGFKAQTTG